MSTASYRAHSDVDDADLDGLMNRFVRLYDDDGDARLDLADENEKPLGVAVNRRGRVIAVVESGPAKVFVGAEINPVTVRELAVGAGGVGVPLAGGAFKGGRVSGAGTIADGDKALIIVEPASVEHPAPAE